ncbi:hypothetical protein DHB64_15295 [Antarcticibacterium sp. W02-3]|nr:hypothetical protein [Antarcticibacterium sp. W02-3]
MGLLAISCSEEDKTHVSNEKATISFGAVLNDLLANRAANKQEIMDLPACTNDEPSYVQVILLQGENEIVGAAGNPFRIDLVTGQIFTEEVPELELEPRTYTLDHFAVYNAAGGLIWLAPRGGALAAFVENPLPLTIEPSAGVKKYVDVPVICYDDRDVNEYGYLFFELNPTEAYEFCFFANYCNDTGRHFPGYYSVDIWLGSDDSGTLLYSGLENSVSTQGEDPAAQPLCIALPNIASYAGNEDYIYYEITLLDWPGVYGDVDNTVITGTLSRDDIEANFDGENAVEYEHIRFGCDMENTAQFDSGFVTTWMDLVVEMHRTTYFNPQSAKHFAYSGLALYEAVVPGMSSYQSVFPQLSGENIEFEGNRDDLYWPASANAALAQLARNILQDFPQPSNLAAIDEMEASFNEDFMAMVSEEKLQRSIAFGQQVANQVHNWSTTDNLFAVCDPYVPAEAPGTWVPTLPAQPAGACLGGARSFITNIAASVLPGPPPAYSEDPESQFYQMNELIYEISQNLTDEDQRIIAAWRDTPGTKLNGPTHVTKLTADLIESENLNLAEASVLLAKQGIAIFDAIIATMNAKYEYTLLWPNTYIQEVLGHATWNSIYPTPPHPSYPAIATSVAAATIEVLEDFFGEDYALEDTTQEDLFGIFYYDSLDALIDDVKLSRTHSGLNYEISVDVGEEVGRAVGEAVNSLNFKN